MDTTAPACVACHRELPAWDTGRFACPACHAAVDSALAELPGLVAQLDVTPGRSGPRVGSLHAAAGSRPPIDLAVVDLRTQIAGVLASWVRDWSESGAGDLPPRRTGRPQAQQGRPRLGPQHHPPLLHVNAHAALSGDTGGQRPDLLGWVSGQPGHPSPPSISTTQGEPSMARTDHHGPRQIPDRVAPYRARPRVRSHHQRARLALRLGTEPPRPQRRRVDWDVT